MALTHYSFIWQKVPRWESQDSSLERSKGTTGPPASNTEGLERRHGAIPPLKRWDSSQCENQYFSGKIYVVNLSPGIRLKGKCLFLRRKIKMTHTVYAHDCYLPLYAVATVLGVVIGTRKMQISKAAALPALCGLFWMEALFLHCSVHVCVFSAVGWPSETWAHHRKGLSRAAVPLTSFCAACNWVWEQDEPLGSTDPEIRFFWAVLAAKWTLNRWETQNWDGTI